MGPDLGFAWVLGFDSWVLCPFLGPPFGFIGTKQVMRLPKPCDGMHLVPFRINLHPAGQHFRVTLDPSEEGQKAGAKVFRGIASCI